MKTVVMVICLLTAGGLTARAQTTVTQAGANGETGNSASAAGRTIKIASETRIAAQLQNTLDANKARVGDQVILKTMSTIKSEGQVVVNKGARLVGHITDVTQKSKTNAISHLTILFDRLETGLSTVAITATIASVAQAQNQVAIDDQSVFTSTDSSVSGRAGRSSGNGGLVGGVTNTVGGAVGGATSTLGETVGATTPTPNLTKGLGHIRISDSINTSAEGGSVLSLTGKNLHLEKGTRFNLVLSQSASGDVESHP
ncbi:MAG: hypothetical protein ABR555_05795 [Pyrinomonadaceae bacterium]